MSDETTPQDDAAMSPASDGSVAGDPLKYPSSTPQVSLVPAKMFDALVAAYDEIDRLRLTDAEREAVECGISHILDAEYDGGPGWPSRHPGPDEPLAVVALRGLLERLK